MCKYADILGVLKLNCIIPYSWVDVTSDSIAYVIIAI